MSDLITWRRGASELDAEPAAVLRVTRSRWEAAGATFVEVDDGDGEEVGFAVGQAATSMGPIEFAVLDYGEDTTFLLVPGRDRAAVDRATAVLETLQQRGIAAMGHDLVDFSAGRSASRVALEARLAALEDRVEQLSTGAELVIRVPAELKSGHWPESLETGAKSGAFRAHSSRTIRSYGAFIRLSLGAWNRLAFPGQLAFEVDAGEAAPVPLGVHGASGTGLIAMPMQPGETTVIALGWLSAGAEHGDETSSRIYRELTSFRWSDPRDDDAD